MFKRLSKELRNERITYPLGAGFLYLFAYTLAYLVFRGSVDWFVLTLIAVWFVFLAIFTRGHQTVEAMVGERVANIFLGITLIIHLSVGFYFFTIWLIAESAAN